MNQHPAFVIDASAFIEAARLYYAFDLAPGFWNHLIRHLQGNRIRSIDRVRQELEKGNDELAEWAIKDFSDGFYSTDDPSVIEYYGQIINWLNAEEQFQDAGKMAFAQGADGWLVAYAKAHHCVVVTREVLNREAKRRVPIPNVCQKYHVPYKDTFAMLRELGMKLMS